MRVSGAGRENLMVIIPMAIVFALAVIAMGGPTPLLNALDRHVADLLTAAYEWLRSFV